MRIKSTKWICFLHKWRSGVFTLNFIFFVIFKTETDLLFSLFRGFSGICKFIKSNKQESEYSELGNITAGVYQGNILRSLLYVMYTSDIPEFSSTTMATFADNSAILSVARKENEAKTRLQHTQKSVIEWTRKWSIKLNTSKSKCR